VSRYDYPGGKLRARVGLGASQVRTRQVRTRQNRAAQVGAGEVRVREVRANRILHEVKVQAAQVSVVKVHMV